MSPGLFQDFMDGYINFLDSPSLLFEMRFPSKRTPIQRVPNRLL